MSGHPIFHDILCLFRTRSDGLDWACFFRLATMKIQRQSPITCCAVFHRYSSIFSANWFQSTAPQSTAVGKMYRNNTRELSLLWVCFGFCLKHMEFRLGETEWSKRSRFSLRMNSGRVCRIWSAELISNENRWRDIVTEIYREQHRQMTAFYTRKWHSDLFDTVEPTSLWLCPCAVRCIRKLHARPQRPKQECVFECEYTSPMDSSGKKQKKEEKKKKNMPKIQFILL